MQFYLIRHAHAGQRQNNGHDIYRPLSDEGRDRAAELAAMLAGEPIERVLSSPAIRCVQTVEPLSEVRGIEVEERQELWEGSTIDDVFSLFTELRARADGSGAHIAACSHGDIIPHVIDRLARVGVPISGRGCELGSIWILDFDGTDYRRARYLSRTARALT